MVVSVGPDRQVAPHPSWDLDCQCPHLVAEPVPLNLLLRHLSSLGVMEDLLHRLSTDRQQTEMVVQTIGREQEAVLGPVLTA
jgi:hypothetical protein